MNAKMLGLFSGFPARAFPEAIAKTLQSVLTVRNSLIFVSAWPDEYAQNDRDAAGMHGMFAAWNLAFREFSVIDRRMNSDEAQWRIQGADCIFLMGGHATQQMQLINALGIAEPIRQSTAVILGVSAGASNMAKQALDIWESPVPYEGLGLTDMTIKAHVTAEDHPLLQTLQEISTVQQLPVFAMADESAVFVTADSTACVGEIRKIENGTTKPWTVAAD